MVGGFNLIIVRLILMVIWLMMVNNTLVGGIPIPLKNDGLRNSWDDEIPN